MTETAREQRSRERYREILIGYDEAMQSGILTYSRNGTPEVAFASQKNYISLYITKNDVLNRHCHQLQKAGKGCIRYSSPAKMDFAVIEHMPRETVTDTRCLASDLAGPKTPLNDSERKRPARL
jgi:hypothetical protein